MNMDLEAGSAISISTQVRRPSKRRSRSPADGAIEREPLQTLFSPRRKHEELGLNVFNSAPEDESPPPSPLRRSSGALPLTMKDIFPPCCDPSRTLRIATIIVITVLGFLVISPVAPRLLAKLSL